MIQSIVEYLNNQLLAYEYYTTQHGLIEIITQGENSFPAKYMSGGKYKDISTFNRKGGSCYFRLLGNVSTSVTENNQISCKKMVEFTVPLRFVSVIPKNKLTSDNQYSDHELALELVRIFSTKESGLKATLKAKRVDIVTTQWNENSEQVFNDEYVVFGNNQLDSKYSYLYIDIQVTALVSRECLENYCTALSSCDVLLGSLSDEELLTCILPSYDFANTTVQANVTAQQQSDLQSWLCVGADATVQNSDASYNTNVPCGDTLILPDITVTEPDGSTSTIPSVQDVDVRDYKSGIAYQRPMVAIQSTSYNLYDAGWRLANTVRPSQPPYPVSYAELDWTALNPFITLKENNAFGNKNRFTDELGTQAYATNYAIDHLTGYGIALITPTSANWATSLSNINSLTHATFSDYFMPTLDEFNSVCDMEINNTIGYSPLSIFSSGLPQGTDFWTSITDSVTTANAQTVQPDLGGGSSYNMRRQAKTAIHYYLPMRYHY